MAKTELLDEPSVIDGNGNDKTHSIVVHNDDHNSFDWVIRSFVDILQHSPEQAEQCAYIIHHKQKCGVKNGELEVLRPLKAALVDRGLTAKIESSK